MKKNPLVPILGGGVIAALVLGVMAVIVLVDAGLLHLLGVRCDSFGWRRRCSACPWSCSPLA